MTVPLHKTWNDSGQVNNTTTTMPRLFNGSATPIDGVNLGSTD